MRVEYCTTCHRGNVVDDGVPLMVCQHAGCYGRKFEPEPPMCAPIPLKWTEWDLKFLRAMRITIAVVEEPASERE